jgi:hypothetical protein
MSPPVQDPLFDDLPIDFREMLAKPIGDWEGQNLLPTGYYYGECVDVLTGRSNNKKTLYFGFICQVHEPGPQMEAKDLKAIETVTLTDYEFPRRERLGTGLPAGQIWITPGSMNMNREFFTSMGFPETKPQDECIRDMRGKKVLMGIGRDPYVNAQGQKREFNVMSSLQQDDR